MSGVNYALIGYVWIRGRFDPAAGLFSRQAKPRAGHSSGSPHVSPAISGRFANVVHGVGLVMGMAWAFVDSKRR
jgi:membrane associated rhomboid family serine protease